MKKCIHFLINDNFKKIKFKKSDIWVIIYLVILVVIVIDGYTKLSFSGFTGILLIVLLFLPFFMEVYFKVYNTYFLGLIVYISASTIYANVKLHTIRFAVGMTIFIFFLLLLNIFLTMIDLYKMDHKREEYVFLYHISKWAYNNRFLYIVFTTFYLLILVILSFAAIYEDIYLINPESFAVFAGEFDATYLSFTTYFTIGFGDIVPKRIEARIFVMAEMFLSYILTALIIPLFIVSLFDLINPRKSNKNNELSRSSQY
ncbi:MAG: potassium channel family protein [Vallitaleaceae bacterium]|nr:potassium channel family protein [Vallitaleaceae bacterium]